MTTDNAPAIEAATEPQPATIPPAYPAVTVSGLRTIHYWLDCIRKKAAVSATRESCGITARADLEVIEHFAGYGLEAFGQINDSLVRKALEGD